MIDVRGTIQTIIKKASVGLMFVAAATMIGADLIDHTVLFRAGITGWLVGATTYVAGRTGITAKVIEAARQGGYEAGYDGGYSDGREIGYSEGRKFPLPVLLLSQSAGGARPKTVPFNSAAQ